MTMATKDLRLVTGFCQRCGEWGWVMWANVGEAVLCKHCWIAVVEQKVNDSREAIRVYK